MVKSLSQDAQDTLMKYLYKGMGMPGWGDVSGSVLLGWHEKVRSSYCREVTDVYLVYTADRGRWDWMYCTRHDRPENGMIAASSHKLISKAITTLTFDIIYRTQEPY